VSDNKRRDELAEKHERSHDFSESEQADEIDEACTNSYKCGYDAGRADAWKYDERVIKLREGYEEREAEIKRLREALEFYGAFENWLEIDGTDGCREQIAGDSFVHANGFSVGGKRAREALKGRGT